MGKGHIIGEYNLFCKGQKYVKNGEAYDRIFANRTKTVCVVCNICGADRYHYHNSNYYCTNCARDNGFYIEERHVP